MIDYKKEYMLDNIAIYKAQAKKYREAKAFQKANKDNISQKGKISEKKIKLKQD